MGPIFRVSLRALLGGRRGWLVAASDLLFVLLALILAVGGKRSSNVDYMSSLFRNLALAVLVPFIALLFASEALGAEVEDRTLIYLTLRPVRAIYIAGAKFFAAALISLAAVWLALIPGFAILTHGGAGPEMLLALIVAGGLATLAYVGVFMLLGLLWRRALLIGVIYILLWEGAIAAISVGAAHLSIRYYATGIYADLLNRPELERPDFPTPTAPGSIVVLAIIALGTVLVTAQRLRRIEQP